MPITINTWPAKDGLRIGYVNLNHAINKLTDISAILLYSGEHFHVFSFPESRLSNQVSDSDVSVPGYSVMCLDPKTHKDTGLLLHFSHSVNLNPLLNWANVCSPNILRTLRRTIICFLIELLGRRTWFGQFNELYFILNWLVMRCKLRHELAADAQQTARSKM